MLVYEYKLKLSPAQQAAIDEAICVVQFIRYRFLWLWMDERGKKLKHNHAARQRARHNTYPRATPPVSRPASTMASPPTGSASPSAARSVSPATTPRPPRLRQSANWHKARQVVAKTYLHLQRQREELARKQASLLVSSYGLIALEAPQIRNLVKHRRLAQAIWDAGWSRFRHWPHYSGRLQRLPMLAVPPHYTGRACSGCGKLVRTSLCIRAHVCPHCGLVLDRDHNAALVIREAGPAQAIQQGVWDPTTRRVRLSGWGSGLENGICTVGHTGTKTRGGSRAPAGRREAVHCPGWRNQAAPVFMRAECQSPRGHTPSTSPRKASVSCRMEC